MTEVAVISPDISLPALTQEVERITHLLCNALNDGTFADPVKSPVLPYVSKRFEVIFGIAHPSTTTSDFDEHVAYYKREHEQHPNARYRILTSIVDPMLFDAGRIDVHCCVEVTGRPEGLRRETVQCHKWRKEGEAGWKWFQMVNMRGHSGTLP